MRLADLGAKRPPERGPGLRGGTCAPAQGVSRLQVTCDFSCHRMT